MDAYQVISRNLKKHETILWTGQPSLRQLFTKKDIFYVPLSLLVCVLMVLYTVKTISIGSETGVVSIGVMFELLGLYWLFGRFIFERHERKNTYYAVTDKRVLSVVATASGRSKNIRSADLCKIKGESFTHSRSGIGSIIFDPRPKYANTVSDHYVESQYSAAFYNINDAKKVYEIYKDAKLGIRNS